MPRQGCEPEDYIEIACQRIAIHLHRGEYLNAHRVITSIEKRLPPETTDKFDIWLIEILPTKIVSALHSHGISQVKDLVNVTTEHIMSIPNMGALNVAMIQAALLKLFEKE